MKFLFLTKNRQQTAVIAITLIGMAVLLTVCFLNWQKHCVPAGKELEQLNRKIEEARLILGQKSVILRDLDQSVEKLRSLAEHCPAQPDRYAWAYEYISRCAKQSQIKINGIEEMVSDSGKNHSEELYETLVSIQCGYNGLIGFLRQLEENNPLLRIKKVTITSPLGTEQSQRIKILVQWLATLKIDEGNS